MPRTGSGKVSSLLADSNAAVPTGTAAGRTATTSVAGGNSQLFSVVVSPGTDPGTPPDEPATGPVLHDLVHGHDLQLQRRGHAPTPTTTR